MNLKQGYSTLLLNIRYRWMFRLVKDKKINRCKEMKKKNIRNYLVSYTVNTRIRGLRSQV